MLFDISPAVSSKLAVWPGDTPVSRELLLEISKGDNVTLSALHGTAHFGAHADGPNHYGADAPAIHERRLDDYLGPCQVIRVKVARGTRVPTADVDVPIQCPRVLFATGTYPDPNTWNDDFAALEPDLVEKMHHHGVRLIGIDTPSVDLFDAKDLPTHNACLRHDIGILEGLVLTDVPEGIYELIALPLRLVGFDGSPVRAILRTLD